MSNPRPVGGRLVSAAILFFAPLAVLCVLLILKRLVFGIGSVTALNGGYPWVYGLPLTYLSVQDLPVAVGHSLGPCIFSIKGISRSCSPSICLQVLFGYSLGGFIYHH